MSTFAFAIQSISPSNGHIFGFAAEKTGDDSLVQIWNGPTSSELEYEIRTDGRTRGGDGTAALPAWAFTGDTDSGWYRIGADNWAGAVGGSKVIEFTSTGNVLLTGGIGVGNSANATSVSGVTAVMEVFDETGASLGFIPIYTSFS